MNDDERGEALKAAWIHVDDAIRLLAKVQQDVGTMEDARLGLATLIDPLTDVRGAIGMLLYLSLGEGSDARGTV